MELLLRIALCMLVLHQSGLNGRRPWQVCCLDELQGETDATQPADVAMEDVVESADCDGATWATPEAAAVAAAASPAAPVSSATSCRSKPTFAQTVFPLHSIHGQGLTQFWGVVIIALQHFSNAASPERGADRETFSSVQWRTVTALMVHAVRQAARWP